MLSGQYHVAELHDHDFPKYAWVQPEKKDLDETEVKMRSKLTKWSTLEQKNNECRRWKKQTAEDRILDKAPECEEYSKWDISEISRKSIDPKHLERLCTFYSITPKQCPSD